MTKVTHWALELEADPVTLSLAFRIPEVKFLLVSSAAGKNFPHAWRLVFGDMRFEIHPGQAEIELPSFISTKLQEAGLFPGEWERRPKIVRRYCTMDCY